MTNKKTTCEICHGEGNNGADDAACLNCGGSGVVENSQTVEEVVGDFRKRYGNEMDKARSLVGLDGGKASDNLESWIRRTLTREIEKAKEERTEEIREWALYHKKAYDTGVVDIPAVPFDDLTTFLDSFTSKEKNV